MYSTARTDVRPPAMALRPRIRPESRLIGASANQGSNLMAADSPESSGSSAKKSPCGHVADARNGFQERLGFAPSWGMLDGVADVVVDRVELASGDRRRGARAFGQRGLSMAWRPRLELRADHLDDLGAADRRVRRGWTLLRFPKRPCLWTHALGEKGDHLRVEGVSGSAWPSGPSRGRSLGSGAG